MKVIIKARLYKDYVLYIIISNGKKRQRYIITKAVEELGTL